MGQLCPARVGFADLATPADPDPTLRWIEDLMAEEEWPQGEAEAPEPEPTPALRALVRVSLGKPGALAALDALFDDPPAARWEGEAAGLRATIKAVQAMDNEAKREVLND